MGERCPRCFLVGAYVHDIHIPQDLARIGQTDFQNANPEESWLVAKLRTSIGRSTDMTMQRRTNTPLRHLQLLQRRLLGNGSC